MHCTPFGGAGFNLPFGLSKPLYQCQYLQHLPCTGMLSTLFLSEDVNTFTNANNIPVSMVKMWLDFTTSSLYTQRQARLHSLMIIN